MPRSTTTLPTEILDSIFTELLPEKANYTSEKPDHGGTFALAALCRTCRLFYDVAQPLLYSVYIQRGETSNANLRNYVHTLSVRPDLAARVKHVTLAADFELEDDDARVVRVLGLVGAGMESLVLDCGSHPQNMQRFLGFLEQVTTEAEDGTRISSGLAMLKSLVIKPCVQYSATKYSPDIVLRSLLLPRIEHLEIRKQGYGESQWQTALTAAVPSYLSPLESLTFAWCKYTLSEYLTLTSRCASFLELNMFLADIRKRDLAGRSLTWRNIASYILTPHASTLQHLWLTAADACGLEGDTSDSDSPWASIESLAHFTALRTLCINSYAIAGSLLPESSGSEPFYRSASDLSDVLPASLERVAFTRASPAVLLWSLEQVLFAKDRFPWLRQVNVFGRKGGFDPEFRGNRAVAQRLRELVKGFEEVGVEWRVFEDVETARQGEVLEGFKSFADDALEIGRWDS